MKPDPLTALVEISNATVWRGDTCALRDLSLTVGAPENLAILGPNGAGKTTLLRLLTRDLYPVRKAGSSVTLLGRETWNIWDLRRHLGIVSHDLQMDYAPGACGRDVALSGFTSSIGLNGVRYRFSATEHDRTDAVLRQLGIADLATKRYSQMSTGEQRRFLLARALVAEPQTLVLDEPLAGLDLQAAFDFLRLMRELIATGVSIVLVTHHVNEIPPEIERIVLLDRGRIVADGAKREVLTDRLLSALYGTPVRVRETNGYFVALPG
ncbi:MAG: ATP-binding cassette domain-containing protein [Gammaproteobacteria bacterium]|nr:ATP-binding cassette domain-containing protein [Gammaproteobacteria bacterium]